MAKITKDSNYKYTMRKLKVKCKCLYNFIEDQHYCHSMCPQNEFYDELADHHRMAGIAVRDKVSLVDYLERYERPI